MRPGVRPGAAAFALVAALVAALSTGGVEAAAHEPGELDSRLAQVAAVAVRAEAAALRTARESGLPTANGRVRVVVEGSSAQGAEAVRAAGGDVVQRVGGLVEALVAPADLRRLSEAPGVSLVRAPYTAVPAVVGEGVAKLNATAWHAAGTPGFTGAGVKIAVIDLGFGGLDAAIAAGELPAGLQPIDRCPGKLLSTTHGVGVSEIVHDVAPGAELTLVCVATELDLAQALADAKARGVRVIVHSVLWLNTSRGDGTGGPGTPDAITADARTSGLLWVNAAGNETQKHWSGTFTDTNSDGLHEFAGADTTNGISVASTGEVCAFLKWDEWPVTDDDFDLELVLPDGTVFASSTFRQNGDDPPTEASCGLPGGAQLAVRIRRIAGNGTPRFDLFWIAPGQLQFQVSGGSVAEPGTAPHVLAVGAICSHTGALQPYSSRGPTIDGRTKPDLVSYDAVSTGTYGVSTACTGTAGFAGTSAAAPHVGGAAALLLEERPGLTPADLQAVLEGKSIDLPPTGFDNDTGRGRLFLAPDVPAVADAAARLVEQTTATAAGAISPQTVRTTYRFEYGTTAAYGSSTVETPAGAASVSAPLTGLQPETTYHYRLVATNPFGTSAAPDGTFTTLAYRPPTATTGTATNVGSSGASLTASVNPNGKPTSVAFELGSTAGYGSTTATVTVPAGNTPVPVSMSVSGLAPTASYHFRVVAQNELGMTTGADEVLTTTAPPAGGGGGGGGGSGPDLELTGGVDRATVPAGDAVLYHARVRLANAAASPGTSEAILTATLPPGAELTSAKASRGPGCNGEATVVCPLSFISGNVDGDVELGVRLTRAGAAALALSVRANEPDPDGANNAVTVVVTVTGRSVANNGVESRAPKIVLRRSAAARALKAVVRGRLATMAAELSVDKAARLRLRVVDLRTGRGVRLAKGSRLGVKALTGRAPFLETRLARAGAVRASAVLERALLLHGRRYALELVAVDAAGRAARLRVPFTV